MESEQVGKAVEALMKHCRAQKTNDLTSNDEKVSVQVVFKKVPSKPKHPIRLTMSHATGGSEPNICLITKDPQRQYKDLVKSHGITVGRVIDIGKLKKKFKELEAKRVLCNSYDCFLVDERVLPIVPRWLGKYFYTKGKAPIQVNLKKTDLSKEFSDAVRSYMVSNLGKGNNISVPCGKVSFDNDQLIDNVNSAVKSLCKNIKPGMKNVKSIYLKTETSVALPVYTALGRDILCHTIARGNGTAAHTVMTCSFIKYVNGRFSGNVWRAMWLCAASLVLLKHKDLFYTVCAIYKSSGFRVPLAGTANRDILCHTIARGNGTAAHTVMTCSFIKYVNGTFSGNVWRAMWLCAASLVLLKHKDLFYTVCAIYKSSGFRVPLAGTANVAIISFLFGFTGQGNSALC
eukprot:sb/3465327/